MFILLGDHHDELLSFIANQIQCKPENIIDFDLRTYAAEKSQLAGLKNELILSGRLDNLFGVFTAIRGLVESTKTDDFASDAFARIAVCFDHEEVGSESAAGAKSGVFEQILKRLVLNGKLVLFIIAEFNWVLLGLVFLVWAGIGKQWIGCSIIDKIVRVCFGLLS